MLIIALYSFKSFSSDFDVEWPKGESAVAWKAKKRSLIFIIGSTPVGINKSIEIKKNIFKNQIQLEIIIPLDKFDSENKRRETDGFRILGGDLQIEIIFRSEKMSEKVYQEVINGNKKSVLGQLDFNQQSHKVEFKTIRKNNYLLVTMQTTHSHFKIDPPSMLGGFISYVSDEIELLGKLYLTDLE